MVKLFKFILIGFIQGVTEVLPVSSSGHLILAEHFLNLSDIGLSFVVFLHIASLISIIFFLRKTIIKICKGVYNYIIKKDKSYYYEFKYVMCLIISTIPLILLGPIVNKFLNISSILLIGIFLIINGLMLLFLTKSNNKKYIFNMNYKDALTIGLFQCFGLLPGISRSGSCLCGSTLRNINKEDAADYVFLMFIPAILGAIIFEIKDISILIVSSDIVFYIISFLVTLFVTYYAFKFLLKIIRNGILKYFSYYCFILGSFIILYSLI